VACLRKHLDRDSSQFEKVILASYLRGSNGDGRIKKLIREYSYAEVIAGLRQLHMNAFVDWLSMSFSEQQADIRTYLANPEDGMRMLGALAETGRAAIPPEAKPHEAQLFTQNLEMIRVSLGGSSRELCNPLRMNQPAFKLLAPSWIPLHRLRY
jgi:hypothetical protein